MTHYDDPDQGLRRVLPGVAVEVESTAERLARRAKHQKAASRTKLLPVPLTFN